jgi:PAS domain S-box-containing protein
MLAVRGSNDGIWDWNLRDNSLYLSPRWKAILGFDDTELENCFETFASRIHPGDKAELLDYVERYLKGEVQVYSREFACCTRMAATSGYLPR